MINQQQKILVVFLSAAGISILSAVSILLWWIGVFNQAVSLEKQFDAAVQNREAVYDNMIKQIQEKFAVAKLERETVKQMIDAVTEGRTGGSFFKSVQEQSPEVNPQMFQEVLATIGGKRDELTRSQQNIMQIQLEHSKLREQAPSKFVVGGRSPLQTVIISSSKTKDVVSTGIDDESAIK